MKKFYITTAIAYPNGRPHLGHALEIIQADVLARFHKLQGKEVIFQTGTDEHGIKNWQTAKKLNKDIMQFLDENVKVFKELYKLLNIEYDNFLRTTDIDAHHVGAKKLWTKLVEAGDLYKKKYKGQYCVGCESFKTEKELENGKCPDHPTREIETIEEENYFFKLSKYKDKVIELIKNNEYKVIPETRKNEILSFLENAKDISFSRTKENLPWGIPVPETTDNKSDSSHEDHIMYVWCDALSNYITGAGYGTDQEKFNDRWPADIHVIGKDILRFHAAFWPAMLLSANISLPKELFVHGFIMGKGGAKMGKSTGNVIEPFEQIEKYTPDLFRFYIVGSMPMDGDGEYSENLIQERINKELAGNFSNFCYRVLAFTNKNFNSEFKEIDQDDTIIEITAKFDEIKQAYENCELKKATELILSISDLGNSYFQNKEPWKTKDAKVLGTCINIVKNLSILLQPIMPEISKKLQKQINVKDLQWKDLNFNLKNHKINNAEILVRKFETKKSEENNEKEFIADLRVAKITAVQKHPDAEKLFIEQIDYGTEKSQIVSGLAEYYNPEELVGKNIIVVTNLKKAKLRGVESFGMLLAASKENKLKVLEAPNSKPGDQVKVEGYKIKESKIKIDDFFKIKITTKDKKVIFNDIQLKTDSEELTIDMPDGSEIS